MSDLARTVEEAKETAEKAGCEAIHGAPCLLLLDLDGPEDMEFYDNALPFIVPLLEQQGNRLVKLTQYKSKGGAGRHIVLQMTKSLPTVERLLLQACLGSDRKREFLSLVRVWNKSEEPSLLFRPKKDKEKENERQAKAARRERVRLRNERTRKAKR